MVVLASLLLFVSIVALSVAMTPNPRPLPRVAGRLERPLNDLTRSPIGGLVRRLADLNEKDWAAAQLRSLEIKLLHAGKPWGGVAASEFLAASELAGGATFAVLCSLTMFGGGVSMGSLVFPLVLGVAAAWVVHTWLDNLATDRQRDIGRQFPFFLDLAVMTMEAGSTFQETAEIYVRDNPDDALSQELRVVLGELSMGKRIRDALESFSGRVTGDELLNTLRAIVQGLRMGTPLGEVLREQAEMMRFKRSQSAERAAEEIKVRVQPPMVVMMLSVFLLIMGPALVQVFESDVF
jgi:tight adherence protein C